MHDEPWDFFRFSPEAWGGLFNTHTGFRLTETQRGEAVVVSSLFNPGGPFDGMDRSPGFGLSVCVAEKVTEATVTWDARMSNLKEISYAH